MNPSRDITQLLHRIDVLERQSRAAIDAANSNQSDIAVLREATSSQYVFGAQNLIRNGNFDLDRNRYLYDTDWVGTNASDVSEECAHWYMNPADEAVETTGTILNTTTSLTITDALFVSGDAGKAIVISDGVNPDLVTTIASFVDSTHVVLSGTATADYTNARVRFRLLTRYERATDTTPSSPNTAVKTSAHSAYTGGIEYDKVNGFIKLTSSDHTLDAPLQYNYITPSKQYIVSFIYRYLSAASSWPGMKIGFWDNTSGQNKFIEGKAISVTASTVGTAGSTSRDYFIVMTNGAGQTTGTEVKTIATTNAVLDANNYVALSWSMPVGTVKTEIYRKTGATYELLPYPYPQSSFYDKGQILRTVTGFPTVNFIRPTCLLDLTTNILSEPNVDVWSAAQFNIPVPFDYDLSKTTDLQWFVIGLSDDIDGELEIDLVCVDEHYGSFTRCPTDFMAKRQLSTAPTSSNQGTTGSGNPPVVPGCPVFDALILTDKGYVRAIELVDHEDKYKIVDRNGDLAAYTATVIPPQPCYKISAGGETCGSETHPFFQNDDDQAGKRLKDIARGDKILRENGVAEVDFTAYIGRHHTVKISLIGSEKGFWQDGFAVHNAKPLPPDIP